MEDMHIITKDGRILSMLFHWYENIDVSNVNIDF